MKEKTLRSKCTLTKMANTSWFKTSVWNLDISEETLAVHYVQIGSCKRQNEKQKMSFLWQSSSQTVHIFLSSIAFVLLDLLCQNSNMADLWWNASFNWKHYWLQFTYAAFRDIWAIKLLLASKKTTKKINNSHWQSLATQLVKKLNLL